MNQLFRKLSMPVFATLCLLNCSPEAAAQDVEFVWRKTQSGRLAQFEPGTREYLFCSSVLADITAFDDIPAARELSKKNLKLAKKLVIPNAVALAHFQLARWNLKLLNDGAATRNFQSAKVQFDKSLNDEFVAPCLMSTFAYETANFGREGFKPNQSVEELRSSIDETEDENARLLLFTLLYMVRMFGDLHEGEGSIVNLRAEVIAAGTKIDSKVGELVCHLVACNQGRQMTGSKYSKLSRKTRGILEETGGNLFYSIYHALNGKHGVLLRKDILSTDMSEAMASAKRLGSKELTFSTCLALGVAHMYWKDLDQAKVCLEKLEDDFPRKPIRARLLDSFYRFGFEFGKRQKDADLMYKYGRLLSANGHRAALAKQQQEFQDLRKQLEEKEEARKQDLDRMLKEEEARKQDLDRVHSAEVSFLKQKTNQLRNILFALVGLLLLGAIGVSFALMRRRIGKISSQLETQQNRTERERQLRTDAEQRLVRMQRMESLGVLAGGIAHDFNNLLVGVIGNAELLVRSRDSSEEFVASRAKHIIQASEKAADLSRQMLIYSGQGNSKHEDVDLHELLLKLEAVFNSKGDQIARVRIEKAAGKVFVRGNPTQIDQIVMNLVSNAQRVSKATDEIVISIGHLSIDENDLETDRCLFGQRTCGGEFGYIEVSDCGPGIEKSEIEKVFDPFYGTSEKGRGLGLAVVYGLVSSHDGLVSIDSRVDVGTKMRVLLPILPADEVQEPSPPTIDAFEELGEPLKVLVVDDEPTILEWIERLGDIEKIEILTAKNGREVVEIFSSISDPGLTCIVLDLMMPDMDGTEVLSWLESKKIDVPVVVMSGHNQGQLRHLHRYNNVMGVIEKPFSATDLLSIVRRSRVWAQLSD